MITDEAIQKLEASIINLKTQLEATSATSDEVKAEFIAQGKIKFMKGFIKKIPDFDWDHLGPGNKEFAEHLKEEITEEGSLRAEAARVKSREAE